MPDATGIGAWTLSGNPLWHFRTRGWIIGVADLDANNTTEVVISTEGAGGITVLSGETGKPSHTVSLPSGTWMQYYNLYVGHYVAGLEGEQLLMVTNNPGASSRPGTKIEAFLFSFKEGAGAATLVWRQVAQESTSEDVKFIRQANSVVGDVDNDGAGELVIFVHDGFVVLDLSTGRIEKYLLTALEGVGRSYGTYAVRDVDDDGLNELVILADLISLHLDVYRSSKDGDRMLWRALLGGVWPIGSRSLHVPGATALSYLNSVDGSEILYSDWSVDNGWNLTILNAASGEKLHVEAGLYAIWAGDLDGDGIAEIVATRERDLLPRRYSDIVIASFKGNRWELLYESRSVWLQGREGGAFSKNITIYGDNARGRSQDQRQPFVVDWDRDGLPELLFLADDNSDGLGDRLLIAGFNGDRFEVKHSIPTGEQGYQRVIEALDGDAFGFPLLLMSTSYGGVRVVTIDGESLGSFVTAQAYNYKYLIADTDGDCANELIVEDARGVARINVLEGERGLARTRETPRDS